MHWAGVFCTIHQTTPAEKQRQVDSSGDQQTKLLVKRGTVLDVAVEDPGFVLGFSGFRGTDRASG